MHREWKEQSLRGKRLMVLFSGGGDSTALLSVAGGLKPVLGYELWAGHIHHGPGLWEKDRDQARDFCREFCQERGVPFLTAGASKELVSEAALRNFRRDQARLWQKELGLDRLLLAHHAQDLLETRFFRLMRGTGGRGLRSMQPWVDPWWRPFLSVDKNEIVEHLQWDALPSLEDPSNHDRGPQRNWLRHELFPQLEKKRPGSLKRFAGSLQNLVSEIESAGISERIQSPFKTSSGTIPRPWFLTLDASQQRRALAQYLWGLGQRHFRQTQLEEIRKRLDKSQTEHRFSLAGCDWRLNAGQIQAVPQTKISR